VRPTRAARSRTPAQCPCATHAPALPQEEQAIVGGVFGGDVLDAKGVEAISKLPTKQELMGQVATLLTVLPTKLGRSLNAAGAQRLARGVKEAAGTKMVRAVKAASNTKE